MKLGNRIKIFKSWTVIPIYGEIKMSICKLVKCYCEWKYRNEMEFEYKSLKLKWNTIMEKRSIGKHKSGQIDTLKWIWN